MCLLTFSFGGAHAGHALVLADNRDEELARPTEPMHYWTWDEVARVMGGGDAWAPPAEMATRETPGILAGRDVLRGGTWMALSTHTGRFAVLTNYRDDVHPSGVSPSRGQLVVRAALALDTLQEFGAMLEESGDRYDGYNLVYGLVHTGSAALPEVYYYSNKAPHHRAPVRLTPGVYALSNELLDSPWPKCVVVRTALGALGARELAHDTLRSILSDPQRFPDAMVPRTGLEMAEERVVASVFVRRRDSDALPDEWHYGTRAQTTVLVRDDGAVSVEEKALVPAVQARVSTPTSGTAQVHARSECPDGVWELRQFAYHVDSP